MIVTEMLETEYHARPELSSTQARQLLESPARYKWALDHPQEPKAAFDVGTAAHTKILGVGAGIIAYPDEHLTASGNVSTKAATVAWAEDRRAEGLTPVSPDQIEAVDAMAEAVLANKTARRLLEQAGTPEASVFGTDPDTGVDMRARFDFLPDPGNGRRVCVDLKTSRTSVAPGDFARTIANLGYDVQYAHYLDTLEFATGDKTAELVFITVEKDGPYLVATHQLEQEFADMGRVKAAHARRLLKECRDTDTWPGYPDKITLARAPMYALYDFQDRYENQ